MVIIIRLKNGGLALACKLGDILQPEREEKNNGPTFPWLVSQTGFFTPSLRNYDL